jgi:hypothetical protein
MPQYTEHEYLRLAQRDFEAYDFTFALVAYNDGVYYPVGSACLIGPGFAVTAKHVLRYMHKVVAGLTTDEDSPDVKESKEGPNFNLVPDDGVGLDALQYLPNGSIRRFAVSGYIQIGYKYTDLMVLRLAPHASSPLPNPMQWRLPTLDLVPPKAGRKVHGYGFPDHPHCPKISDDPWLSDHFLYQSLGEVQRVNLEDNFKDFQTSMRTMSGMSGGPVFATHDREDRFCGIIVRGGPLTDWSLIAPVWQIAYAVTNKVSGLPERNGKLYFADMMIQGIIPAIGAEFLTFYDKPDAEPGLTFVDQRFMENGY